MSDVVTLQTNTPLPCPRCQKLFRLPEGFTSVNALACPHCNQQVTGQEILSAMAPTATIVDVPVATQSSARPTRSFDEQDFVIPKPLKTAQRRSRSRSQHPERKSSLSEEGDESNASSESGSSKGSSSSRSSSGRSSSGRSSSGRSSSKSSKSKKTPPANPLGELFKIVLGGLLALPIAQLVLWWAFNSDPLGIAPRTSQFAAFLVPPKLQPLAEIEEEDANQDKDLPTSQELHDDRVPVRIQPD